MNDQGIHPAPLEFTTDELAADPILRFFHYAHLPAALQATSRMFCETARFVTRKAPRSAERTVSLRKLLEAKDAAVRAMLPAPRERSFDEEVPVEGEVRITGGDKSEEPIPFT